MKRLMVMAGAAMALVCAVSAAGADPRDSVDRGDRLDRDALRDDVRINRLKVPEHPVYSQQPEPVAPAAVKKGSASRDQIHRRRRPHTRAMPTGPSNRQMQLRQEQEKSR